MKVVIRFPRTTETWSLNEPPRRGQRVRSHSGDVYFVADVLESGINTYVVTCASRRDFLEDLRQQSRAAFTSELVAVTRRPILSGNISDDPAQELYRGFRRDESWIEKYLGYAAMSREGHSRAPGNSSSATRPSKPKDDWIETYLNRTASSGSRHPRLR